MRRAPHRGCGRLTRAGERPYSVPIVIAGVWSGVGKTTLTLSLLEALRSRGQAAQAFKVGPDFIDAAYHELATGRLSYNIDGWICGREQVLAAVRERTARATWPCLSPKGRRVLTSAAHPRLARRRRLARTGIGEVRRTARKPPGSPAPAPDRPGQPHKVRCKGEALPLTRGTARAFAPEIVMRGATG
jgi:hypothetical protein